MPRFVILLHECPTDLVRETHFDLMLEDGETLRTWAMASEPNPGVEIEAECLAKHRVAYLDYEGPLTGNRGSVSQWDQGTFAWLEDEPDAIELRIAGKRLTGLLRLSRLDADSQRWTVAFTPD